MNFDNSVDKNTRREHIDAGNKGGVLIYQSEDGLTHIEVKMEDETVQQQMVDLFHTSRTNVVEHIGHIYEEKELDEVSTCRKFRQVRLEVIELSIVKFHSITLI